MTGLAILTFIPLIVAIAFMIRMRGEQKARLDAERRLSDLTEAHTGVGSQEWYAVLTHELRSPVAAILGYEELLEDGTFGELTPPALDATRRIRLAAQHLVSLIEGLERGAPSADDAAPENVGAAALIADAASAVTLDAEGRGSTLSLEPSDVEFSTRRAAAERALVLMLGAAIKASPGAELTIGAHDADVPRVTIRGTRLDPDRDSGHPGTPLTGAAFRLQLARDTARAAQGSIDLEPDGSVHLSLPRL